MATASSLANQGLLIRYVDDDDRSLPVRSLFLSHDLHSWIEGTLVYEQKDRGDLLPIEQVEALFHDFVYRPNFRVTDWTRMTPHLHGIISAHTVDVRIFGWFHRPQAWIAAFGSMKKHLKQGGRYEQYRDQTVNFRNGLPLSEPKFQGGHPRELI